MRSLFLATLILAGCSERSARTAPEVPLPQGDAGGGDGAQGEGEGENVEPVGPPPAAGEGEGEAGGEGPGDGVCADDPLEPNDSARSAHAMLARSERGLILCPGDEDWFALAIRDGDGARAGVFAEGVRLELRDDDGVILAVAAGGEQAEAEVVDGEVVYARISDAEAPTPYDLFFEAIPAARPDPPGEGEGEGEGGDPGDDCVDDLFEPNPDPGQARAVRVGLEEDLALCPGDEDWFTVRVGAGQQLSVALQFSHQAGDIDLYLFGAGGPPDLLGASAGGSDAEVVIWDAPPDRDADVLVQVVGFAGAGNSSYDLTVALGDAPPPCREDDFEPNDARFDSEALRPGEHGGLTVCDAGDEDWFHVDLDEGDDVEISLVFRSHEANLDLDLHDPGGARVARSATFRAEEVVRWRAARDGRHAFRVHAASVRGAEGAPYQLEITVATPEDRCGRDGGLEPNDSRNAAEEIDPGTHRDLQLCFEDEDWYELPLNGGDEFEVELRFDDDEGDIDMQLFEPGSNSVWERSESHSDNERIAATAEEAGAYLLRVFGEEAGYDLIFEVDACEPDDLEDNDSANRSHRLRPGDHRNLTQCGADEDWYSVDVDEGDDIRVRIEFRNSDGNIDLRLHSPGASANSQPLDRSETSSNAEEVEARAERDGAHLIRVFPRRPADAPAVEYTLELEVVEAGDRCPDDRSEPNDSRFSARDIREGTTRDLTLCGEDEDWYEIDVDAGDELTFSVRYDVLEGSPGGGSARLDLELHDPNGREEDDDRGSMGRAEVSHVAERDGDHHLRVVPSPDDAEIEYEVVVTVEP